MQVLAQPLGGSTCVAGGSTCGGRQRHSGASELRFAGFAVDLWRNWAAQTNSAPRPRGEEATTNLAAQRPNFSLPAIARDRPSLLQVLVGTASAQLGCSQQPGVQRHMLSVAATGLPLPTFC